MGMEYLQLLWLWRRQGVGLNNITNIMAKLANLGPNGSGKGMSKPMSLSIRPTLH